MVWSLVLSWSSGDRLGCYLGFDLPPHEYSTWLLGMVILNSLIYPVAVKQRGEEKLLGQAEGIHAHRQQQSMETTARPSPVSAAPPATCPPPALFY